MPALRCPACDSVLTGLSNMVAEDVQCQSCGYSGPIERTTNHKTVVDRMATMNPVLLVSGLLALVTIAVAVIIATIKISRAITLASVGYAIVLCGIAFLTVAGLKIWLRGRAARLRHELQSEARVRQLESTLSSRVATQFMVESCSKCHEFAMLLLEVSPNGRSIQYQCLNCSQKRYAPAISPDAHGVVALWGELLQLLTEFSENVARNPQVAPMRISPEVVFACPASPLPYEQTERVPIPQAVRSGVWRRDGGKCVHCGSKENLQFDHIIPVAKGGATSAVNLQLLCRPCNLSKGARI